MKKILTTAAILAAMAVPVFAEGDDPSAKAGEPKSSGAKASTDAKQESGSPAMGQGAVIRRSTTGAAPNAQDGATGNPGQKTGIAGGNDGGGADGGSGASGGSGAGGSGGSGGSGSR